MNARFLPVFALLALAAAARAQYSYTQIDADDETRTLSGSPALNDAGQVAYRASVDGDAVLLRHTGGASSIVAGPGNGFGFIGFFPTINASGQVGFAANLGNDSGIFRTSGGGATRIDAPIFDNNIDFFPSLNGAGRMAFRGELQAGFVNGIYAGDGTGPVVAVYDENGPYDGFGSAPSINNAGQIAFTAVRDADGAQVLLLGNGGTPVELADTAGDLGFINDLIDLNDAGDVAFAASLDDGSSALYRYRGGALTSLATSVGGIGGLAMNASGEVAYVGSLDDGSVGLFAPGAANPLLTSGSTLLGKTLFGFGLSRDGLNASGQIAFMAFFDDGSTSLVVANPVPEPASVAALGLGALAALRRRRK